MREVEVKAKVNDVASIIAKLSELGCVLSDEMYQKDQVYIPKGLTVPVESGVNVLRIREQAGKFLFTLKIAVENQLDCIERELEISDGKAMEDIIFMLGFHKGPYVEKRRRKAKYKDLEICVDEVRDLGSFIEVEKLVSDDQTSGVQEELFAFLETLGILSEDRVHDGYDVLMQKKLKGVTQ